MPNFAAPPAPESSAGASPSSRSMGIVDPCEEPALSLSLKYTTGAVWVGRISHVPARSLVGEGRRFGNFLPGFIDGQRG